MSSARVVDLVQAGRGHLHHAYLLGRTVAVLQRAQQAQGAVAVALEHEHRVHEVLEGAWTGQGPVLGHVAHQQHGHALLTCERSQLDR